MSDAKPEKLKPHYPDQDEDEKTQGSSLEMKHSLYLTFYFPLS